MLSPDDFDAFFNEVYGYGPFPWQTRLLRRVVADGAWPAVLDLPTGSGKTAAIDVAVFHLALEADRFTARCAPVRIAFVVDRRLVVDDAFSRAQVLAKSLTSPLPGAMTARVAARLKILAGEDGPPLIARRLRGGIPREDDWARTPSQPTVLCSTVDQVGSRLLFRGYGVSHSMKPVHAGLIGADCLILLDEAHLAEPFRQTLRWISTYKGENWREENISTPWGIALLTATPGEEKPGGFTLNDDDRIHPVLRRRLDARKPARLVKIENVDPNDDNEKQELGQRATAITKEVLSAIKHFGKREHGAANPAIGVVVNRVARAREVFKQLLEKVGPEEADSILLIGPARPVDRDDIAEKLIPVRTRMWRENEVRTLDKPFIVVATQCIEAGVDIDLDALITEAAPLDCLRQRFGRLNRAGRKIESYAAILATKSDIGARTNDPVYGKAVKEAWDRLAEKKKGLDFRIDAFDIPMAQEALSPKTDAPILMPAHLDMLSQTSPIPASDPEVALYLHGPSRQSDSVALVWRGDIAVMINRDEDTRRLLTLTPPRSTEAIELPVWAVRRWLAQTTLNVGDLADVATSAPEEARREQSGGAKRRVFRWAGNDERSCWVAPAEIRPGDTIIVPTTYGGVDEFGWNPLCNDKATDVWHQAARPFAGRRFAVRVAPGLIDEAISADTLTDALAGAASARWQDLRSALLDLNLPQQIHDDLLALDDANRKNSVMAYPDLYGLDNGDHPRGVVFVALFGINGRLEHEEGCPNATEDDFSGSLAGFPCSLERHSVDVEQKATRFAKVAGLPNERVADLKLAGYLHDAGKADRRFQAWLYYGDPLGPDLTAPDTILAKSGRVLPKTAHAAAGLPNKWRHEALSVRLAPSVERFAEANDPELVLWLIGTHHGHGRPFFPHQDPEDAQPRALPAVLGLPSELPPALGPQSLAFDWEGMDWSMLFERLKARYGVWELARMEAILRLADHRASEERARESNG